MKQKAFVTVLEMIVVIATLIAAYSVLFPGFSYQNRWGDAFVSLKGRDLTLTLDRTGNLFSHSFNETNLRDFLDRTAPTNATNLIHWSSTEGSFKPIITVACDCTPKQISALIDWTGRIRVNNRSMDFDIVFSGLDPINFASDVLLIWGDKNLEPFENNLKNYLRAGKGIIEIMDLKGSLDNVQKSIFGIEECSNLFPGKCGGGSPEISFEPKPIGTSNETYASYKYFHHVPAVARTSFAPAIIDFEPPIIVPPTCSNVNKGDPPFSIKEKQYDFWICDGTSVYFDINPRNGKADTILFSGSRFTIDGQNLLLSYIDGNKKIGIAFLSSPEYKFGNFLHGNTKLYPKPKGSIPTEEDKFRILLSKGTYTQTTNPIPAVILNGTVSRVAWVADFTRNLDLGDKKDQGKIGNDHKLLLTSLLLWASDKKHVSGLSNLRLGHLTSYVNVVNEDMYEVYKFDLGLGFPF